MEPATWANCREDFVFDGALLYLIVPGSGTAEWEMFWEALKYGPFGVQVFREGVPIPLPESVAWIFAEREQAPVMVSVRVRGVTVNCHFNGGDLKLDIDPREVTNESAFEAVLGVMRFIATAVRLAVFVVPGPGSPPDYPFLRVSPDGKAEYLPAGSVRRPRRVWGWPW